MAIFTANEATDPYMIAPLMEPPIKAENLMLELKIIEQATVEITLELKAKNIPMEASGYTIVLKKKESSIAAEGFLIPTMLKVKEKDIHKKKIPRKESILGYFRVLLLDFILWRLFGESKVITRAAIDPKT